MPEKSKLVADEVEESHSTSNAKVFAIETTTQGALSFGVSSIVTGWTPGGAIQVAKARTTYLSRDWDKLNSSFHILLQIA